MSTKGRFASMSCASVLALFVGLFLVRPAAAEIKAGDQIVGVNVGGVSPFAKWPSEEGNPVSGQRLAGAGIGFGGQYLYHLTPAFGVGVEGDYDAYGPHKWSFSRGIVNEDSSYHSWDAQAVGRYVFIPDQPINPYIIVGAGVGQVIEKFTASVSGMSAMAGGSATGFSFAAGVGADYSVTDNILVGLEARYRDIASAKTFNKGSSSSLFFPADQSVKLAAKISYKFGGQ